MVRLLSAVLLTSALLSVFGTVPTVSFAQSASEPWLVSAHAGLALPLGAPQSDLYGPGVGVGAAVHRPFSSWLSLGAGLSGVVLSDAGAPSNPGFVDPGVGGSLLLHAGLRVRLPLPLDAVRRAPGVFVEVGPGLMWTGDLVRMASLARLGVLFDLGPVALGPTVQWNHIFQSDESLSGADSNTVILGLDLVLFDRSPPPEPVVMPPPPDRDGDGIIDSMDNCPDEPEDRDEFEDEDGCPDPDNDRDGILDDDDDCPLEPEDVDQFQDADGCPDPDNDRDGILDTADECPNHPEVINGVDDQDGCPDEGIIEFINDRVVLDSRVLFGFDQAFLRPTARPILDAMVNLWRQHPEWDRIRIEGHSDRRGDDEYNLRLSQRRAENVRESLVERGIPAEILEAEGFGRSRPITRGSSEASLRRNRRVEFVVVQQRPSTGETAPQQAPAPDPAQEEVQ